MQNIRKYSPGKSVSDRAPQRDNRELRGSESPLVAPQGENPHCYIALGKYFVPAGTTGGLCGRPPATFAAHPYHADHCKIIS